MIFWKRQAEFYNVPLVTVDIEKIDLGWAIGSSPKAVIGIMDQGMADAVRKKIAE